MLDATLAIGSPGMREKPAVDELITSVVVIAILIMSAA